MTRKAQPEGKRGAAAVGADDDGRVQAALTGAPAWRGDNNAYHPPAVPRSVLVSHHGAPDDDAVIDLAAGADRCLEQHRVEIAPQDRAAVKTVRIAADNRDTVVARNDHAVDVQSS